MRSWFFGWLLVTKIRWLGCFFSKFRVSPFRADVAFSVTTIWFSNVIPFNLIISFYICFITNTNANLLHLLVFSFTGMFFFFVCFLFFWGIWLILGHIFHKDLMPEVRFPMYMLLNSFLFFLPDFFFLPLCLLYYFISFWWCFLFLFSFFCWWLWCCFQNRSLCFKKCFNYFILPLLAHFTKKLTCFWRISFDFFQQFKH